MEDENKKLNNSEINKIFKIFKMIHGVLINKADKLAEQERNLKISRDHNEKMKNDLAISRKEWHDSIKGEFNRNLNHVSFNVDIEEIKNRIKNLRATILVGLIDHLKDVQVELEQELFRRN